MHYITLHHITLHYITSHYITLHYITLHYNDVDIYYVPGLIDQLMLRHLHCTTPRLSLMYVGTNEKLDEIPTSGAAPLSEKINCMQFKRSIKNVDSKKPRLRRLKDLLTSRSSCMLRSLISGYVYRGDRKCQLHTTCITGVHQANAWHGKYETVWMS